MWAASVLQSYFTFHILGLWRLELEIRDNEVKVGKDCLRGFSYFFGVWTNCVNHRCYTALRMGEYRTDINHRSKRYQWSRHQVIGDRNPSVNANHGNAERS
jgi:hypothetical protein